MNAISRYSPMVTPSQTPANNRPSPTAAPQLRSGATVEVEYSTAALLAKKFWNDLEQKLGVTLEEKIITDPVGAFIEQRVRDVNNLCNTPPFSRVRTLTKRGVANQLFQIFFERNIQTI